MTSAAIRTMLAATAAANLGWFGGPQLADPLAPRTQRRDMPETLVDRSRASIPRLCPFELIIEDDALVDDQYSLMFRVDHSRRRINECLSRHPFDHSSPSPALWFMVAGDGSVQSLLLTAPTLTAQERSCVLLEANTWSFPELDRRHVVSFALRDCAAN